MYTSHFYFHFSFSHKPIKLLDYQTIKLSTTWLSAPLLHPSYILAGDISSQAGPMQHFALARAGIQVSLLHACKLGHAVGLIRLVVSQFFRGGPLLAWLKALVVSHTYLLGKIEPNASFWSNCPNRACGKSEKSNSDYFCCSIKLYAGVVLSFRPPFSC